MAKKWFAYQLQNGRWVVARVNSVEAVTVTTQGGNGISIIFQGETEGVETKTYDLDGFISVVLDDPDLIGFMADSESS